MRYFMSHKARPLISSLAIATLLCAEAIFTLSVRAATLGTTPNVAPDADPIRLSQLQPWRQTYDCGEFAITLSEQARDRYTYEAANASGQTLTLTNGSHHSGRNYSSIYTFNSDDGTQYVLEDFGGGKAALSTANYPDPGVTYDCTTDGNP